MLSIEIAKRYIKFFMRSDMNRPTKWNLMKNSLKILTKIVALLVAVPGPAIAQSSDSAAAP